MNKIIVRIRGGLGNQLFGYAFGRQVAINLAAELILDGTTSFNKYDKIYKRVFELDKFNTSYTFANNKFQLHPFEKIQRNYLKAISYFKNFNDKIYINNFNFGYDKRFDNITSIDVRYLDGMWQSEKYFIKIKHLLQNEITLNKSLDQINDSIIHDIRCHNSVAIHVRWFDEIESDEYHNIDKEYYKKSIKRIQDSIINPKFYIFSDDPNKVKYKINLDSLNYKIIDNNMKPSNNYKDLILMKECMHQIIANSTFSWWAAWLNLNKDKIVICPKKNILFDRKITTWGFQDQLPDEWIKI